MTRGDVSVPVVVAAAVPLLVVRLGWTYLRLKVKRRGGVQTFRAALLRGGMNPRFAEELAAQYESFGRLRSYLKAGFPFVR